MAWGKVTAIFAYGTEAFEKRKYNYQLPDQKPTKTKDDDDSSDDEELQKHVMLLFGGFSLTKQIVLFDNNEWKIEEFVIST